MAWKIVKAWNHAPVSGSDRTFARSFVLERSGIEAQSTVEFAAGGKSSGSTPAAQAALRPYLGLDKAPPRRLVVARDGGVRVVEEAESD